MYQLKWIHLVLGRSSTDAGMVLLPGAIIGAVFSLIGGIILDKWGTKKPIFTGVISNVMFVVRFNHLTYMLCIVLYFVYSLGIGLIVGNTMTCALSYLTGN